MTIKNGTVDNQTRISKVIPRTGASVQETLPNTETRCALLANLLCCEGKPGQVKLALIYSLIIYNNSFSIKVYI